MINMSIQMHPYSLERIRLKYVHLARFIKMNEACLSLTSERSLLLPVSDEFSLYLQMLWFQSLASYYCACLPSNTMALIGLDSYLHLLL